MLMNQYEGEGKLVKSLGISDRVRQDNDFNKYGDGQKSWHLERAPEIKKLDQVGFEEIKYDSFTQMTTFPMSINSRILLRLLL